MSSKDRSERLSVSLETKMKCMEHNLTDNLATKILFSMLDTYVNEGTTYINKKLSLNLKGDINREYLINLYNDRSKRDVVLIRAKD